ncbi:glycerophosphodiester phosphodiesterase [Bifidobacterium sp.]|uniref:glycerophosphodiester phosphodiesterase n=1 Tax=Bifidobacterium sp. TaxID=41200 RepID=UPI0039EAC1FC
MGISRIHHGLDFSAIVGRILRLIPSIAAILIAASMIGSASVQLIIGRAAGVDNIPIVMAHRGGSETSPAGSEESFRQAVQEKLAVEMDLRKLADGNIAISHDSTTQDYIQTIRGSSVGTISTQVWESLCLVSSQSKCYNPTVFSRVLKDVPDSVVMAVENKQDEVTVKQLEKILDRSGHRKNAIIESLDFSEIQEAAEDGFRTMYVVHKHQSIDLQAVADAGTEILAVSSFYSTALAGQAQAVGLHLWVWTVDRPFMAVRWAKAGADGLITDYPLRMRRMLETNYALTHGVSIPQLFHMSLELQAWLPRAASRAVSVKRRSEHALGLRAAAAELSRRFDA